MGIKKLWNLLQPAAQECSLTELAIQEGFETNRHGCRSIIIGVDVSIWLMECKSARNGVELQVLFYRLARLLRYPVELIFVFDGPKRPSVKRGHEVLKGTHWLTRGMQELLNAFGFPWYTAPGEAEAELAELNERKIIDAVLSKDGDVFLFGATQVIREINFHKGDHDKTTLTVYTARAIENATYITYRAGDYLLIAVLGGGDYDPVGLRGCGIELAVKLSRSGLGESLLQIAYYMDGEALALCLEGWRAELCDALRTDPGGYLGMRYANLADSVPRTFPCPETVLAYVKPATSWSNDGELDLSSIRFHPPNVPKIASFCERKFSWQSTSGILGKLDSVLWDGLCMRMLVQSVVSQQDPDFMDSLDPKIHKHKWCPKPGGTVLLHLFSFSTAHFVDLAKSGIRGKCDEHSQVVGGSHSVWVPSAILALAIPGVFDKYIQQNGEREERSPPNPILSVSHLDTNFGSASMPMSGSSFKSVTRKNKVIIDLTTDSD